MQSFTSFVTLAVALAVASVLAQESHTVTFTNNCGTGTPTLIQGNNVLSTGGAFTSNGPLDSAIAYLQTGRCGFNGESCTMVELTLTNEGNSAVDITLIPPHVFSVTSGFGYYNGCEGKGADCTSASCCPEDAYCSSTDNQAIVSCDVANVNLAITFCD